MERTRSSRLDESAKPRAAWIEIPCTKVIDLDEKQRGCMEDRVGNPPVQTESTEGRSTSTGVGTFPSCELDLRASMARSRSRTEEGEGSGFRSAWPGVATWSQKSSLPRVPAAGEGAGVVRVQGLVSPHDRHRDTAAAVVRSMIATTPWHRHLSISGLF